MTRPDPADDTPTLDYYDGRSVARPDGDGPLPPEAAARLSGSLPTPEQRRRWWRIFRLVYLLVVGAVLFFVVRYFVRYIALVDSLTPP